MSHRGLPLFAPRTMIHDEVSRANARRERREARSTRQRRPARVRATLPHGLRRRTSRPESREICRNALRDRGSPGRVVPFGADVGRKPVVEPGPDAGVRISSAKTPRLGPTVCDAGRGRVGHRSLRDVRGTEHGFDDGHGGAALDAMRARILGMQRRVVDRLPGGLAFLAGLPSRSPLRIAVERRAQHRRGAWHLGLKSDRALPPRSSPTQFLETAN